MNDPKAQALALFASFSSLKLSDFPGLLEATIEALASAAGVDAVAPKTRAAKFAVDNQGHLVRSDAVVTIAPAALQLDDEGNVLAGEPMVVLTLAGGFPLHVSGTVEEVASTLGWSLS